MGLLEKISLKIRWLRAQPESVKVRYIWISALVVFAIVAMLWVGLFRKYERKATDNPNNSALIEEGEKIKNDLKDKIKIPEIKLPEISPKISPSVSPLISPAVSSEVSPEPL